MRNYLKILIVILASLDLVSLALAESKVSDGLDRLAEQLLNTPSRDSIEKITVLPFSCSSDLHQRRVGFAAAEVLKSRLTSLNLKTTETSQVQRNIKTSETALDLDNDSAVEIASRLNSPFVVVGSIQEKNDLYQMNVRLISSKDKKTVSAAYEEFPISDFDDYCSPYLVDSAPSGQNDHEALLSSTSKQPSEKRSGKMGFDFFWLNVKNINSNQFENETGGLASMKFWFTQAMAVEIASGYYQQTIKDFDIIGRNIGVLPIFAGLQMRLDKGQKLVPYIGGGVAYYYFDTLSSPNFYPHHYDDSVSRTSQGDYFNLGLTGYLSDNKNWSFTADYRRVNIDLIVDYNLTVFSPYSTTSGQIKIDMDTDLFSLALGYHFK